MKTTHLGPYVHLLAELTARREGLACTQLELGVRLGKPQSYVSKVEAGQRRLDLVEYIYWCKALDVDPMPPVAALAQSIGKVLPGGIRRAVLKRKPLTRR